MKKLPKPTDALLVQVDSGYFSAGLTVRAGVIIKAAPILGWAKGKQFSEFLKYARARKWVVLTV